MDFLKDWPFPAAVAVLFVIVMLRANGTYWLGRLAHAGADRTRLNRALTSRGYQRAERLIGRWGAPAVTLCFLTVGVQTVINLAAGVTRMPLRRYLPAVTIGGLVWAFLYATVGFVTWSAWRRLYELSPVGAIVVGVLLLGGLAAFVVRQARSHPDGEET